MFKISLYFVPNELKDKIHLSLDSFVKRYLGKKYFWDGSNIKRTSACAVDEGLEVVSRVFSAMENP